MFKFKSLIPLSAMLATIATPLLIATTADEKPVAPSPKFGAIERLLEDAIRRLSSPSSLASTATNASPPDSEPTAVADGVALVSDDNTTWDDARMSLISSFRFPLPPPTPAGDLERKPIPKTGDAATDLVRQWIDEGTASGWNLLLYDNRDRDHSNLDVSRFPNLTRVEYSASARAANADWNIRNHHAFDQPAFGNSSTALVGNPFWRSNPRMLMHDDLQIQIAERHFLSNQLYCYPEHNDFDPQHGDVYPANVPYWVISQGSSGSDQPFLNAIALTLAAFQPDVRDTLVRTGRLMVAVQILLRRSQRNVTSDDLYFSAAAHPVVFQAEQLDPVRMVTLAHELTIDSLPAMTRIRVVEEDLGVPGRDYFHPSPGEQHFDTSTSIARVHRTTARQRRMVFDASGSSDDQQRSLTFRWSVLQGDPEAIRIEPLNASGSRVSVTIPWHPSAAVPGRPELKSNRVDIGVFALNGVSLPLPAFVSSFTLANEVREYHDDGRIRSVTYKTPEDGAPYVDPVFDVPKSWRDDYVYDETQRLLGWTRSRTNEPPQEFSADGRLIITRDVSGKPSEWRTVAYEAVVAPDQTRRLQQVGAGTP